MTDYMRQDLLREEQTGRDGYSVGDTVSSPPHPSLQRLHPKSLDSQAPAKFSSLG